MDIFSMADMFGSTVNLNVQGIETFRSVPGAILTIFLWGIMLQQGMIMFNDLTQYRNIKQSQSSFIDLEDNEKYNLLEYRQEFVFAMQNRTSNEFIKVDPRLGYFEMYQKAKEWNETQESLQKVTDEPLPLE